jgi:predicted flap endonuclease-1-like 5' DNA nuclease
MPHPIPSRDPNGPVIRVQFFIPETPFDSDLDGAATREQGRPIYRTREYVRVINPSDPNNKPLHPAHEKVFKDRAGNWLSYAEAYAEEYRAFKAGLAEQSNGTPLTELTGLTAAMRAELKAIGIMDVENLAAIEGATLKRLGMNGTMWRTMAQTYLEKARGQSADMKVAAENAALKAQIDAMRADLEALKAGKAPAKDENDENPSGPDPFAEYSDDDLKVFIESRAGKKPHGRSTRETLLGMARELLAAEMTEAA